MKKFLVVLGILMLLIIATIVAIPMMFQSELQEMAITEANKTVNAKIEMEDFNLSIIPNFPNLTAEISGVSVSGMNEFEGVTLFKAGLITTTIDLMKLFDGNIEINEIGMDAVDVNVVVLKNGKANYDIAKESTDTEEVMDEEVSSTEETDFKMLLKRYFITNFNLIYDDREGDMYFAIENMNHTGKGDFTLSQFILETETSIKAINFKMEGDSYLKNAKLNSEINVAMDMDAFRFQFDTTFIQLNALILNLSGWLAMPGDSIDMDIAMSSKNNSFKELFSLIPEAYTVDYEDVKVTGNMSVGASFKGIYYEDIMPAFTINLNVKNGKVKYPDLPATAENIGIDLNITSPGGDLNRMVIDLKKAHLELAENYFDLRVLVKNSISNPSTEGNFKMDFDLATISTMMPVEEGEEYEGKMKVDLDFKADMNSLDREQYNNIEANGTFEAWDIVYDDGSGGVPMAISHVKMAMNMNKVDLLAFDAMMGKSDVHATGGLENFIPWYMNDATISGNLRFNSNYFNVDEWMTEDEVTETTDTTGVSGVDSTSSDSYMIPTNIAFVLDASMKTIDYDSMIIEDLKGRITIENGQVVFANNRLRMFEGVATMDGVFDPTTNPSKPSFDFTMEIKDWAIKPVANTFNTIEKLAPVLKNASGTFSTTVHTTGILDANLEPIMDELSFSGVFKTNNISLNSDNLEKLNKVTKTKNFNPLSASNVRIKYKCSNGILETEPFEIKIGSQKAKVSGYTTLNEEINYLIDTKIKTSEMGAGADALLNEIGGFLASNGIKADIPETIPVVISVTGKIANPTFKPVFGKGEAAKEVKEQVKEIVKEKIEEVKKDLKKEAQAEADKIMADAKKQQAQIMAEARKQAAALNQEAKKLGNQLKAEADKQAKDLVKQATNPLTRIAAQKAGDELRKQADQKAKDLGAESDKQGKKVIATAQTRSDKMMSDAKKRADAKIQGI